MFNQACVADRVESLFETKIGKTIWPIYAAVTIAITIGAVLGGKVGFVRKFFLNLDKGREVLA